MTHRVSRICVSIIGAVLLGSAVVAAPAATVLARKDGARLLLNGRLVTIFRSANGSSSPEERATLAADRLNELIAKGLSPKEIEVRSRGENWGVYARGGLLMIATIDEAEQRHEDPKETAVRWAANLKTVLGSAGPQQAKVSAPTTVKSARATKPANTSVGRAKAVKTAKTAKSPPAGPALALEVETLAVPVGETRKIEVKGTAHGEIGIRIEGEEAAEAALLGDSNVLQIRGVNPGKSVVHVTRGGKEVTLVVWVKQPAGRISGPVTARVTGTLAPASLVAKVARENALAGLQWEPGAVVKITGDPEGVKAIPAGETTTVAYPITIAGDGFLPVKGTARVQVQNVALPRTEAKLLLYSNDPESVREYGTLYEGVVENSGPVRLLYHHQNRMGRAFTFQVQLLNPTDAPVDVQVVGGEAGPYIDPLQAGHRAAQKYLAVATEDVGYVTQVPAHGSRLVTTAQVPNEDTVSGIYSFRILQGGPLVAQVSASQEPVRPTVAAGILAEARQEPHTYPTPQVDEHVQYVVGDRWTFVPIGRKAITGKTANRKLFGNYGVLYNITVDLSNPTSEEKTVSLVLSPEAGWTRGVFVIEGKLVEVPQIAPPAEATLWTIKLGPNEQRRLNIQGIPVGGSAYPVSLVVRS